MGNDIIIDGYYLRAINKDSRIVKNRLLFWSKAEDSDTYILCLYNNPINIMPSDILSYITEHDGYYLVYNSMDDEYPMRFNKIDYDLENIKDYLVSSIRDIID